MKIKMTLGALASMLLMSGAAFAAATAEEAKQLGAKLTLMGAEKAGNADGSIPAYEGGLPTSTKPANFKPDSGKWPNPFAAEKPLFTITAATVDKYADKLSEGSKALFKRYPEYRMGIYKTHRTANWPQHIVEKTGKNAVNAKLDKNGYRVTDVVGGIPFPIPKSGMEVMYNHLLRYQGQAAKGFAQNLYVDASGKMVMSGEVAYTRDFPYNWPESTTASGADRENVARMALNFTGPARAAGDANVWLDSIDYEDKPRRAYAYSASTRRVRLAPDISYDTPIASTGGVQLYDDEGLFAGKMDRFDFKLIGKKEVFIPYNGYDWYFYAKPADLLTPKFPNPDFLRWELHRVWVVEATLKSGARHVYSKRVFYLDEDWTGAGVADMYDMGGKIYKSSISGMAQLYDKQVPWAWPSMVFDLSTGAYSMATSLGASERHGWWLTDKPWPNSMFVPDALPARSGR